jgi:hypothetical protein
MVFDMHINAAQCLFKQANPGTGGLQEALRAEKLSVDVEKGVFNSADSHGLKCPLDCNINC